MTFFKYVKENLHKARENFQRATQDFKQTMDLTSISSTTFSNEQPVPESVRLDLRKTVPRGTELDYLVEDYRALSPADRDKVVRHYQTIESDSEDTSQSLRASQIVRRLTQF